MAQVAGEEDQAHGVLRLLDCLGSGFAGVARKDMLYCNVRRSMSAELFAWDLNLTRIVLWHLHLHSVGFVRPSCDPSLNRGIGCAAWGSKVVLRAVPTASQN